MPTTMMARKAVSSVSYCQRVPVDFVVGLKGGPEGEHMCFETFV